MPHDIPEHPVPAGVAATVSRLSMLAAIVAVALAGAAFIAGCEDEKVPKAAPAVDRMARRFLHTLGGGNLDSIRMPLSQRGKDQVTSTTIARTLAYFEAGPPADITLVDAEIADSRLPTPAERHRLTYRLAFTGDRNYYYFFELMIEGTDSTITGFRVEPAGEPLAR